MSFAHSLTSFVKDKHILHRPAVAPLRQRFGDDYHPEAVQEVQAAELQSVEAMSKKTEKPTGLSGPERSIVIDSDTQLSAIFGKGGKIREKFT